MRTAIDSLKIVLLCVASAILYGVLHDQVTARVCVEYFTIGHPALFDTESPTLLAFGWGIVATWWAGAILGVLASIVAQIGPAPKYDAKRLLRPIALLLLIMATLAAICGVFGYFGAQSGLVPMPEPIGSRVPGPQHAAFMADLFAHLASYVVGFIGGVGVCGWIALRRYFALV